MTSVKVVAKADLGNLAGRESFKEVQRVRKKPTNCQAIDMN